MQVTATTTSLPGDIKVEYFDVSGAKQLVPPGDAVDQRFVAAPLFK